MGMNIVQSGDTFQVFGESLQTYKKLPVGTYEINFSKMMGFYLSTHNDLVVSEEKIYGSTPKKVDKVLKSFSIVDRNFGVILSGKKGIGKSLFARQLAVKAKDYDLPLIIVDAYIPGIANFLSSIEQEVIVLFDEFEKTFANNDEFKPQEEMLSLFDGIDGGKKLFIVTCNEVRKLNSYLLNRPGRFHYHFILGNPNPDEIKEYMTDKLNPEYHYLIKKLISFSMNVDLTYDVLRAIAFEINNGFSFEETLMDLNISKEESISYKISVEFSDGHMRTIPKQYINLYSSDKEYLWFSAPKGGYKTNIRLTFMPSDITVNLDNAEMILDPSKIDLYVDEDYFEMSKPEDKALFEHLSNLTVKKMTFERVVNDFSYKFLV